VTGDRVDRAIAECLYLGLEPVLGAAARGRLGYLAGPDPERAADLNRAFRDPAIDAVWSLRGGYGAMRLLPDLDFESLRRAPKPFIGFSDNTAIHLALAHHGVISFHGPHPGALETTFSRACLQDVLGMTHASGVLPPAPDGEPVTCLAPGAATGRLAGGNLSILAGMCGTPWPLRAAGCIVVVEDVGEPTYRIDRMLMQLLLSGCLHGAAGIAFGRFTDRTASDNDRPLEEVLTEIVGPLGIPVVAGVPVGHIDAQWTLPLGARARLDADRGTLEILESAVADGGAEAP
jgi:muramoyltetrapeptide carboxypeptidase